MTALNKACTTWSQVVANISKASRGPWRRILELAKQGASVSGCAHFSYWYDGGCLLTGDAANAMRHHGAAAGPPVCEPVASKAVTAKADAFSAAPPENCAPLKDASNDICREAVTWAAGAGKWDPNAKEWFDASMEQVAGVKYTEASSGDWQRLYFCDPPGGKKCGTPPCMCTHPPCHKCSVSQSTNASAAKLGAVSGPPANCKSINDPVNSVCKEPVTWAAGSGKWDPHAKDWFADMKDISGMEYTAATLGDWQKLYFCAPPGGKQCGAPPCSCSHPPCDQCFSGGNVKRDGCDGDSDSIHCKPPKRALDYNGMAWKDIQVSGAGPFTVFAIGDWGGLDGSLSPVEGRSNLVVYAGGNQAGPSPFPRTRLNKEHTKMLCNHKQLVACYDTKGQDCDPGCGYVLGVDDKPQLLVADAFNKRAAIKDPKFVLNVGDNFYWGGIEKTCGTPMDQLSYTAHHQFQNIYESVYHGPGVDGKVWISALGNHDWGGRQFNNGWDQQIAYTWKSPRWIMPAAYYSTHIDFTDAGFSMDVFVIDTNAMDAEDPPKDPNHNICSSDFNPASADCSAQGGPPSVAGCKAWFWKLWAEEKTWLAKKLDSSKADWQVVVTHFPCGHQAGFYKAMHHQHGLDLLVTGHRHNQELWDPSRLSGLGCFVTGGGGGISSEATPNPNNKRDWYGEAQYGFFDLTISKEKIDITSINYDGKELKHHAIYPKH